MTETTTVEPTFPQPTTLEETKAALENPDFIWEL